MSEVVAVRRAESRALSAGHSRLVMGTVRWCGKGIGIRHEHVSKSIRAPVNRITSSRKGETAMRKSCGLKPRGWLSGSVAVALILAAPLTADGADRMVLGEYFTALW